jgi:hypothetical protein
MRTLSTTATYARAAGAQADFVRVSVKDGGGTWRDLTTYPGLNLVKTANWQESASEPHRTADVRLVREAFKLSISPWIADSALNLGFVHTASPDPLLRLAREFRIEAAVVPVDRQPAAGDWLVVFHGRIDFIDPGGDEVKFGGRDLAGRVADQQLKRELVYCLAVDGSTSPALRPWEPGMSVAVGEYVLPASRGDGDPGQGRFYKCTVAGTTANTEPTWPGGGTVADGTVTWSYLSTTTSLGRPVEQVIQAILDNAKATGDSTVTLEVPSSPGWAVKEYLQGRDKALAAVRALAQQIGWDVRMKWHAASSSFRLTLFEPERAKTTADHTFTASQFKTPSKFEVNLENIRNAWCIKYSDSADTWPDGSPKRKEITVTDAASVAKYGELWAEIAEGTASNIDTSTEATKMVNAALADCAEPTADFAVELVGGFPWCEVGDLYAFDPDGRVFSAQQKLAVTKWAQSFDGGKLTTTLELRGKPSLGARPWLAKLTDHPGLALINGIFGNGKTPPLAMYGGIETVKPAPVPVPGGIEVRLEDSTIARGRDLTEYEVHVSESNSLFTPSSATLKAVTRADRVTVLGTGGGKPMVVRVVPRAVRGGRLVRGQPSVQAPSVAGRVLADLLDSQTVMALGPLNGHFQHQSLAVAENLPDQWQLTAGTWGESSDAYVGSDTTNGRHLSLKLTGTNAVVESGAWPLPRGCRRAKLVAAVRSQGTQAATRTLKFQVAYYTEEDLTTEVDTGLLEVPYDFTAVNTWGEFVGDLDIPEGANFAVLRFFKNAVSSAYGWDVGNVQFIPATPISVEEWIAVSFGTGWSDYGSAWQTAAYCKDAAGFVHVRGLVQRTSGSGTTILTLPAGYRPAAQKIFAVYGDAGAGRIDVRTDGVVLYTAGGTGFLSLEGITFDTR